MVTSETYEIEICVGCASWHANGDTTGIDDPEREEEVRAAKKLGDMYLSVGDEAGFSWSSCDACGSRLGGDRYTATAWKVAE